MILRLENGQRIDFKYSSTWEIIAEAGAISSFIFSMMEPPHFYENITEDPVTQLMKKLDIQNCQYFFLIASYTQEISHDVWDNIVILSSVFCADHLHQARLRRKMARTVTALHI